MKPLVRTTVVVAALCAASAAGAQHDPAAPMPAERPAPPTHATPHVAPPAATPAPTHAAPYAALARVPADSADSLWRAAREALNRTEYRVAARLFRELRERYPRSAYLADASYYEAFSLYRIGTTEDLRSALDVLRAAQRQNVRYTRASMQADAVTLAARIQGALARRGDPDARKQVENIAQAGATCDDEEMSVRVEALSALTQMDEGAALPMLRKVLARRDACSVGLRRRAIFLLIRDNADSSAPPVLLDVVRGDPEIAVQLEAVEGLNRLSQTGGQRAAAALEEVLRTARDERLQAAAVRALASRPDWSALRSFVERTDAPLRLRIAALSGMGGAKRSAEDAAWLRGLYAKAAEPDMKEAIATTVGRLGGEANEQWLVALARNANEPVGARTTAISWLSRSQTLPVAELARIYDAASERRVREYVLRVLAGRKEPEAVDKLIEVARNGTDPVLRRTAISYLSRNKSDPRVQKALLELIDR